MLDHADADQLVVSGDLVELAVVADISSTAVRQTRRRDALVGQVRLGLAQGDAPRVDAVVLRRVHDQTSPATTDFEQFFPWLQAQLAADHVEFAFLGSVESLVF